MISEISQNLAGATASQSTGASGVVNRAEKSETVGAVTNTAAAQNVKPEQEQEQASALSNKELNQVVDDLNELTQTINRQLQFSVDEDSGKTIIKVVDSESGETIRAIPSEEVLDMQKRLKETSDAIFSGPQDSAALLFQGKV